MPINNITQTISTIPEAGRRGVDVQTIFVNKQEAFQDALTEVFVGQINTLRTQLNTFVEQLNTTTTQINMDAGIATNAAERATAINNELKNVSVGSTITGIPSTPASVTYSPITGKFTFVIPRGEAFQVDARGAITDRSLYDTKYQGFGFLALDESKIYFKMSNTSGDWSIGLYFGKGDGIVSTVFTSTTHPSGLAGQSGATDTYTINYSNLETDTFIVKNGEDGLDNITDTVIGTETTWSSTKIKNLLAQKADKVELDQRIDSLGSTTVKLTENQTIAGVKTFSSNIVGNITGNASYATSAGSATNATNASYATSAGSATNATNASYATSAGSATNANYATTQATSDNSTRIATTAFVKSVVEGSGGSGSYTQSLSSNGWTKLPNGLIIQWGICSEGTHTLPIAFPNAFFSVNVTLTPASDSTKGNSATITSRSSFKCQVGNDGTISQTYYIAVGY